MARVRSRHPHDIDQLKHQILTLELHSIDLRLQVEERDQDLHAARGRQPRTHGTTQRTPLRHMNPAASYMHHTCSDPQPAATGP